jgi:HK97 family phage major capsid protein
MNPTIKGLLAARILKSLAVARGDPVQAVAYAAGQSWANGHVVQGVLKAPMEAHNSSDEAALIQPAGTDFAEYVRPLSVIGRLVGLRLVPFLTRLVGQSQGATASWVGESSPKPLTTAAFTEGTTLTGKKVISEAVVSLELVRLSNINAEMFLLLDLARACGAALDQALLDPSNSGTDDKPRSVTFGAPTFTSSGSTSTAIDSDLQDLIGSLVTFGSTLEAATWVMRPQTAAFLASKRGNDGGAPAYPSLTARGGMLLGLPVLTSPAMMSPGSPGESAIVLLDADAVLLADDKEARLEVGHHASLELSDTPAGGATQMVNLWQNNLAALRAERSIAWATRRSGAAATLTDVAY